MRSLRYLNTVLTIIAVLLTINIYVGLTDDVVSTTPQANAASSYAGLPNAGKQRQDMLDELKKLNGKMDSLTSMFRNGDARVIVTGGDKDDD